MLRSLFLLVSLFVCTVATHGQLIRKKEANAIDELLANLSSQHKSGNYLIKDVNVLTMVDSIILEGQDVLVSEGVIQAIGKRLNPSISHEVIDGSQQYLMPGLTDMHVHLFHNHPLKNTWGLLMLLNGITSVRDMAGEPEKLLLRDQISRNEVLFPTIYQAGPLVNGKDNQFGVLATTPGEGRKLVREHKKMGYDFIKVYDDLNLDTYQAIADEAIKEEIQVVGHIPFDVPLQEALKYQSSIEHLTGYKDWRDRVEAYQSVEDDYPQQTTYSEAWNCPTYYNLMMNWGGMEEAKKILTDLNPFIPNRLLAKWESMLNQNVEAKQRMVTQFGVANRQVFTKIVLGLYESKAKLIAGTDAGSLPLMVPGFALHKELALLHEAGIPVYDVLKMTTINAALAIEKETAFGTLEVGKRADLLLLESNPLVSLENLQKRSGLMMRGIWLSKNELERIEQEIKGVFGK